MTDRIIHLILIESNDQIGMDGIVKRVAGALTGDVIQLVPVSVPKPPVIIPPPVVIPPPVIIPPIKWVRLKNATNTVNVRSTPTIVVGNILGSITGQDKHPLLSENTAGWYEISYKQKSGWVSRGYMVIV